jgi:hypothetical protein
VSAKHRWSRRRVITMIVLLALLALVIYLKATHKV